MTEFLQVPITSDATQLADDAIDRLKAQWPGWDPNDGDLEVVLIEALAPMGQNAAQVAAIVPGAIFRKLGTDIYGVPYRTGVAATAETTWTLEDTVGHTIPAGSQVDVDGYVFATQEDVTVIPGDDTATSVVIVASETGTAYNDLTGVSVVPLSALDWVSEVALDAPTSDGVDPEDDLDYQDRFSTELQMQARTVVTLRDHELFVLDYDGVGRAVAYKPDPDAPRDVTIVMTDDINGDPVGAGLKATILADITDDNTRRVNSTVTLDDADYTTVDVDWEGVFYPGNVPADVITRVNTAISDYLSPLNFGRPAGNLDGSMTDRWYNDPVVRWEKMVGLIEAVPGMNYITSLSLNAGGEGDDVTLTGTVALPQAGTITGAQA